VNDERSHDYWFCLTRTRNWPLCSFIDGLLHFVHLLIMATRAKARRPTAVSSKKLAMGGRAVAVPAKEPIHQLVSTLTISKVKGACSGVAKNHSEITRSTQENRISAMRAVNGASQGLTTVMKSGWKAPSTGTTLKKPTIPAHEAFGLAISARAALEDLRMISPGDVDIERAAISVAGKLLSLDMVCR
jgi:hypothetical protein